MTARPLAALVRAHRRAARLTLAELAGVSGVSIRTLGNLERGRDGVPQQRTLDALATALALGDEERAKLSRAAVTARSAGPSGAGVLPRRLPDFTGRAREIGLLARFLGKGGLAVVTGQSGIGKTALAVRSVPADTCFVDCGDTSRDPGDRLRPTARRLVILDNVADVRQLGPLLAAPGAASAAAVLVTSRDPLAGVRADLRLSLTPLAPPESVALLTAITGAPASSATTAVARYCEHLPLALRIAGNRLAGRPGRTMARLADQLADEDRRLAVLSAGDLSVEAALAATYSRLSAPTRALCRSLADAADPGLDAAVLGIPGYDSVTLRAGLQELLDHGLVTADDAGRYRLPELMRIYIRA